MYQLVIQFPAHAVDYDELIAIEDQLIEAVRSPAEVDGHDFGARGGNIFVLTDRPEVTFEAVLPVLRELSRDREATVAYRAIQGERYTVLWPKVFNGEFSVA